MVEYDFRTYSLGFSPFTIMLDKYMFSPCQQLLTGITIGISKRDILYILFFAPLNFIVL